VGLLDKIFDRNFVLVAHNYGRRPKHWRRQISISVTDGELYSTVNCNIMQGSMNGPIVGHSWSPMLAHR